MAASSVFAAPDPPRELIANGGFESLNADGAAENWAVRDWSRKNQYATSKVAAGGRFGQRCLQLEGTSFPLLFGGFSHPVSLDGVARELLLTVWYRTEDSPQADLCVTTFADDFTVKEWDTPALTQEMLPLDTSTGWRSVSWRLHVLPAARQAIVLVRIHGAGSVFVDGVSLKACPTEVSCETLSSGLVVNSKGARQCRVRLTNQTEKPLTVTVQLEAAAPKGPKATTAAKATLLPGQPQTVDLNYGYPISETAMVAVTVVGPQPELIYDYQVHEAPGLLCGRVIRPSFRGTLLPSIPVSDVLVRGRVNAERSLYSKLRLQARLVGLGVSSPDFCPDEQGNWECTLPATTLLTGNYGVEITASESKRIVGNLNLPLVKPEAKTGEAGYDEQMRYWQNGKPRLPLGLYYALDEADFAPVAEAGFNTLVLPSRLASTRAMEQCGNLGLSVIVSSASLEQEFWNNMIGKFGLSPTLAGWYILQKPATQTPAVHPLVLGDLYARLRTLDPRHPVCLALDSISRLEPFAPWADIIMPWTEPEPAGDLRSVDMMIQKAVAVAAGQKPVWPVIQLTGAAWSQDVRLDPATNGRPPTPEEYRCMAYLAFARGANGLFAYAYRVPTARNQREYYVQRDAPELWQMVRRVGNELKFLTPVLLEGEPLVIENPNKMVALRGYKYNGVSYVLAVNPCGESVPVAFKVPGLQGSELEVAFDNRRLAGPGGGEFGDQLGPHAVRVYMGR